VPRKEDKEKHEHTTRDKENSCFSIKTEEITSEKCPKIDSLALQIRYSLHQGRCAQLI
jgi:hypothetical protein